MYLPFDISTHASALRTLLGALCDTVFSFAECLTNLSSSRCYAHLAMENLSFADGASQGFPTNSIDFPLVNRPGSI